MGKWEVIIGLKYDNGYNLIYHYFKTNKVQLKIYLL
jgi:hypothetical protein